MTKDDLHTELYGCIVNYNLPSDQLDHLQQATETVNNSKKSPDHPSRTSIRLRPSPNSWLTNSKHEKREHIQQWIIQTPALWVLTVNNISFLIVDKGTERRISRLCPHCPSIVFPDFVDHLLPQLRPYLSLSSSEMIVLHAHKYSFRLRKRAPWYKQTVIPKKKVIAARNLKDCLPSLPLKTRKQKTKITVEGDFCFGFVQTDNIRM